MKIGLMVCGNHDHALSLIAASCAEHILRQCEGHTCVIAAGGVDSEREGAPIREQLQGLTF